MDTTPEVPLKDAYLTYKTKEFLFSKKDSVSKKLFDILEHPMCEHAIVGALFTASWVIGEQDAFLTGLRRLNYSLSKLLDDEV